MDHKTSCEILSEDWKCSFCCAGYEKLLHNHTTLDNIGVKRTQYYYTITIFSIFECESEFYRGAFFITTFLKSKYYNLKCFCNEYYIIA